MSKYIEKVEQLSLPVVTLRSIVAFPSIPLSVELTDEGSAAICEAAKNDNSYVFFVTQRDPMAEKVKTADLYRVGTVVKISQFLRLPEGTARVVLDGACRAMARSYHRNDDGTLSSEVMCKTVSLTDEKHPRVEALMMELNNLLDEIVKFLPKFSVEMMLTVKNIKTPGLLADFIACNILFKFMDKQMVLEEFDPLRRMERLCVIMQRELDIARTEQEIRKKVRAQIDGNQREYYLRQQLRVIQGELGGDPDGDGELEEYYDKIAMAKLPVEVEERLNKEVKKLSKTPYNSAEAGVIRNYLDTCLELPFNKATNDRDDVEAARRILNRDHDGLDKVKERILEWIAVRHLNPNLRNQIICLVGPPGTGKTSIARSIAEATRRKYVRVSLGGVRDEADIRGHRKTYIGSMPGRIIDAVIRAGVRNPLILLDEIDKLAHDAHGDPSSALLEVLDSEQNKAFRDHFVELPFDLSECLFITTANDLSDVPRPLIDRMEVIELKIYTRHEKLAIAKNHLIAKQRKRHGLNGRTLRISDDALYEIIDFYTREAGVRNLEREIATICRKAAMEIVDRGAKSVSVDRSDIVRYLGERKILPEKIDTVDQIGVVNGLAYTELGGDLLQVEAAAMPGTGKVELTGLLGNVMKESAQAAITYLRSHADQYGIDSEFYKNKDIHIHVPEGATPKDGPSAGVTMVTALTSELSGIPVRRDIAMTGEITLRGRVLPIGGLKEKTMAAYQAGVRTVLIPRDNENDLHEIDPIVREALTFCPCANVGEVLFHALVRPAGTDLPQERKAIE